MDNGDNESKEERDGERKDKREGRSRIYPKNSKMYRTLLEKYKNRTGAKDKVKEQDKVEHR